MLGRRLCKARARILALLVALAMTAVRTPASPASVSLAVDAPCSVYGYITDTDPNGTNVRDAPSTASDVIAHVPPRMHPHGDPTADLVGAGLEVIGSRNGWLLVRHIIPAATGSNFRRDAPGWISGGLVGFTIASTKLHVAPSATSAVRAQLEFVNSPPHEVTIGPYNFSVLRTYACRGRWVDVLLRRPPGTGPDVRGWAGTVCANQFDACYAPGSP